MSANVVPFSDDIVLEIPDNHVSEQLVFTLECLLEDARSGRIHGIGYAVVTEGANASHHVHWAGDGRQGTLGFAIAMLQARYMQAVTR